MSEKYNNFTLAAGSIQRVSGAPSEKLIQNVCYGEPLSLDTRHHPQDFATGTANFLCPLKNRAVVIILPSFANYTYFEAHFTL